MQLRRWARSGPKKKAGRKYCAEFERRVLDEMVFTSLERVDDEEKAAVIANVTRTTLSFRLPRRFRDSRNSKVTCV